MFCFSRRANGEHLKFLNGLCSKGPDSLPNLLSLRIFSSTALGLLIAEIEFDEVSVDCGPSKFK